MLCIYCVVLLYSVGYMSGILLCWYVVCWYVVCVLHCVLCCYVVSYMGYVVSYVGYVVLACSVMICGVYCCVGM